MAQGLFSGLSNFLYGDNNIPSLGIDEAIAAQKRAEAEYKQREQQDYQRQVQLAQYLQRVISGQAPSAAQGQLAMGMDQAQRASQSQAAGATGTNAGLARYGSIMAGGQLMADTNQDAAQLRAQEVAQAVNNTGQLTNSMGQRSGMMSTVAGNTGLDYSKLGFGVQGANLEQENKENASIMKGIGDAAALYFSGGTSAIPKQDPSQQPQQTSTYNPNKTLYV